MNAASEEQFASLMSSLRLYSLYDCPQVSRWCLRSTTSISVSSTSDKPSVTTDPTVLGFSRCVRPFGQPPVNSQSTKGSAMISLVADRAPTTLYTGRSVTPRYCTF
ncbi:hypothetical protein MPH_03165, partial [Macrophomina phaseolina MS6]